MKKKLEAEYSLLDEKQKQFEKDKHDFEQQQKLIESQKADK